MLFPSSELTLAKCSAVIHTLVIIFVLCAEVGVVVVAHRVTGIASVVGKEELVAVQLVADGEEAVFSIASLSRPVLQVGKGSQTIHPRACLIFDLIFLKGAV